MKTRKQYLNNELTHSEYYGQFGKHLIGLVRDRIGTDKIMQSTNEHFNDIPLAKWGALMGDVLRMDVGKIIAKANGRRGISLSDTVCAAKAAARMIRDENADL